MGYSSELESLSGADTCSYIKGGSRSRCSVVPGSPPASRVGQFCAGCNRVRSAEQSCGGA